MTIPPSYPHLTTMLARKIVATDRAIYDPPVGLTFDQKCDLVAESNRLWEMVEAVGLLSQVRTRIALVGPALLAVAS